MPSRHLPDRGGEVRCLVSVQTDHGARVRQHRGSHHPPPMPSRPRVQLQRGHSVTATCDSVMRSSPPTTYPALGLNRGSSRLLPPRVAEADSLRSQETRPAETAAQCQTLLVWRAGRFEQSPCGKSTSHRERFAIPQSRSAPRSVARNGQELSTCRRDIDKGALCGPRGGGKEWTAPLRPSFAGLGVSL
jgi:hypothetical protein